MSATRLDGFIGYLRIDDYDQRVQKENCPQQQSLYDLFAVDDSSIREKPSPELSTAQIEPPADHFINDPSNLLETPKPQVSLCDSTMAAIFKYSFGFGGSKK